MLVCTHCNSQSVVYDQEYVTGTGWISRPRCLKCGRGKFANIDNSKQEEKVMAYLRCKHNGCDKGGAIQGYCNNHFAEKYGITASQYKAEKRGRSEDPLEVAGRVLEKASEKRKLEADQDAPGLIKKAPDPAAEKAAEDIKAMFPEPKPANSETKEPESERSMGNPIDPGKDPITWEDKAVLMELYSVGPYLVITLPPEVKEALGAKAKEEYRSPEQQAAYMIDRALRGQAER